MGLIAFRVVCLHRKICSFLYMTKNKQSGIIWQQTQGLGLMSGTVNEKETMIIVHQAIVKI